MKTTTDPLGGPLRPAVAGLCEVRVGRVRTAVHAALVALLLVVVGLQLVGLQLGSAAEAALAVVLLVSALLLANRVGRVDRTARAGPQ